MSSPSLPASGAPRLHGLDTLRAAAILLVFAYHYQVFVSGAPTFGWLSRIGWAGVDLFFVLSGYLIANQLMGGIARGDASSSHCDRGRPRLVRTSLGAPPFTGRGASVDDACGSRRIRRAGRRIDRSCGLPRRGSHSRTHTAARRPSG